MLIIEMITILIMIAMIKYLIPKNFMKKVKFMMLIMIKMIKKFDAIKFHENCDEDDVDDEKSDPIEFHEDDDEIHDDDSIPKGFIETLMKLMILVMTVIRKNLIP